MLSADLLGFRKLFNASKRRYYSLDIVMSVDHGCILPPFTGKVVKSLLMKASPGLQDVFESGFNPKPISVSTLIRLRGGRREYLWKKAGSDKTMSLEPGDRVGFHVGFTEDISDKVLEALENLDGVELFNTRWRLEEYELEVYELPAEEKELPREYRLDDAEYIKVEFRTPVLLLDPYKKSKYRRFLPLPGILFSYNIGELLRMERNQDYIKIVDHVNALLNETYSVLETVKPVKYIYDGLQLPGLTGYVKYMIDHDYMIITESTELLENIVLHAKIMGVGMSRANGFGYVTIQVKHREPETKTVYNPDK